MKHNRGEKVLVLLEHKGQVKDFAGRFDEIMGEKKVVALTPFAMYELDKQDMPYRILDDYYDQQELYRLGTSNYQKVEKICDVIDKKIQKACPILEKHKIKPVFFSLYNLKTLYDTATIRLFQLSKLIESEKPDVILNYTSKGYPVRISNLSYFLFDERESVYAHLLALDGWNTPVRTLPYVPQPENKYIKREEHPSILKTLKKKALGRLHQHPALFDLALATRQSGGRGFLSRIGSYLHPDKRKPVLILGGGYNWNDCKEELQSAGIGPIIRMRADLEYWVGNQVSDKVDAAAIRKAWQELSVDEDFRGLFVWGDVDFFPLLEDRLRFSVEGLTPTCLNAYEKAEEVLRKREIKSVLGSSFVTCTSHSISQAAHNLGVPVIMWQHGAYGYLNYPLPIHNDIMPSDAHLVFGNGVSERYGKIAKHFDTKLIPVGSTSLDTLNRKTNQSKAKKFIRIYPKKRVVLYVIRSFSQNHLDICLSPPFSDRFYWITQKSIIDVLGKQDNYYVVVKLPPDIMSGGTPLHLHAKEKGFKNCQFIQNECRFTDLLPIADVIIIDFPSTTLLEALTTSKPIFVLLKHLRVEDEPLDLLKRRAYCYPDLENFTNALDTFLGTGNIDAKVDLDNREFLKMYGTHLNDGKSGVRATNTLRDIIGN